MALPRIFEAQTNRRWAIGELLNFLTAAVVVPMAGMLFASVWTTYERDEEVATRASLNYDGL